MKTVLMYDACNPDNLPRDAKAVAGYVDGVCRNFDRVLRLFYPRAHCVSIGVFLGHTAEFSDVETGNAINTPELVRADFLHRKRMGVWRPGYYADHEHMVTVVLPGLAGIPAEEYRLWFADWDGSTKIPPGDAAKQFRSNTALGYDVSVVNVDTFFPHPSPHRHKVPHPPKLSKMHRKVKAGIGGGGLGTGLVTVLHNVAGLHLTQTESAAIAAFLGILAAWLVPESNQNG